MEDKLLFQLTRTQWMCWLYGIPASGMLQVFGSIVAVLHNVPKGSEIRPMGLACWVGVAAIVIAAVGVVVGCLGLWAGRRSPRVLCASVFCLIVSPIPILYGPEFFRWYAAYQGLVLSD